MYYIKALLIGALLVALAGCASTFKRDTVMEPQAALEQSGSILIATPRNGSYGDQTYGDSGIATADAVRAAFSRFSNQVQIASDCSQIKCLTTNSDVFDYYVVPKILHWEDRATEWSGKRDRIAVKITIYGRSGNVIASQVINGKSKWATFGGDHPQDLLPSAINPYIRSLY